jgi:hypothetical protein
MSCCCRSHLHQVRRPRLPRGLLEAAAGEDPP